ncbi:Uncharacterised protein r2_g3543 [Pycnogonum litorale]
MSIGLMLSGGITNPTVVTPRSVRRPRSANSSTVTSECDENEPCPKRKSVALPVNGIRYDNTGHNPVFLPTKNPNRCRYEGCTSRSRVICEKCQLFLCVYGSNCFKKFHST